MPDITPSGNATAMLPATRQSVPTIAGRMPPSVIPFSGIEVRNSQLTTPAPLTMMKPRIHTSMATTSRLVSRNSPKASCCERFLRFDIFEDVIMLSVRYCFFRFSRAGGESFSGRRRGFLVYIVLGRRAEIISTAMLSSSVSRNRMQPSMNSAS